MKWISFFMAMSALFLNTAFGVYKSNQTQSYNPAFEFYQFENQSSVEPLAVRSEPSDSEGWQVFQTETLEVLGVMAQERLDSSLRYGNMCFGPNFCFDSQCSHLETLTVAYNLKGLESTGVTYLD